MLNFVDIPRKERVYVMLGVIRIAEISNQGGIWSFDWFNNHELFRAEELRQIADKLDDLNGGEHV